jgi:hypothetical protein
MRNRTMDRLSQGRFHVKFRYKAAAREDVVLRRGNMVLCSARPSANPGFKAFV